jgi:hypothetical protein
LIVILNCQAHQNNSIFLHHQRPKGNENLEENIYILYL